MYIAYETSPVNKGVYYLPAIGGMMADRPVLRKKVDVISVGDNRVVYEGEHADALYSDILSALASGKQNFFDIPAHVSKNTDAWEAAAAEAAAAEAAETETESDAAAAAAATQTQAEATPTQTEPEASNRSRKRSQSGTPTKAEGSES